jgi:hypothetical protein
MAVSPAAIAVISLCHHVAVRCASGTELDHTPTLQLVEKEEPRRPGGRALCHQWAVADVDRPTWPSPWPSLEI